MQLIDLLAQDALDQARQCDGVMWRWNHVDLDKQPAPTLLYLIEHYLSILVFPDTKSSWHFDNKIAQMHLLDEFGAPLPENWIFWRKDQALEWAQCAPYPLVFTLATGAGSSNVALVKNTTEEIFLAFPEQERVTDLVSVL